MKYLFLLILTMASVVSMAAPVKSVVGGKEIAQMGDGGLSAKSYIQDGLIAMWDGIENAGWGTHDPNATVWKDLIGGLGDFDLSRVYRTWWGTNGLFGPQTDAYGANLTTSQNLVAPNTWAYTSFTVEVVHYSRGLRRWQCVPWSQAFESWFTNTESLERIGNTRISVRTAAYPGSDPVHISNVTTYNAANRRHTAYENSGKGWLSSFATQGAYPANSPPYTGRIVFASNTRSDGAVFAIRVYNRALSAEEIAHNYEIDKARFNLP